MEPLTWNLFSSLHVQYITANSAKPSMTHNCTCTRGPLLQAWSRSRGTMDPGFHGSIGLRSHDAGKHRSPWRTPIESSFLWAWTHAQPSSHTIQYIFIPRTSRIKHAEQRLYHGRSNVLTFHEAEVWYYILLRNISCHNTIKARRLEASWQRNMSRRVSRMLHTTYTRALLITKTVISYPFKSKTNFGREYRRRLVSA